MEDLDIISFASKDNPELEVELCSLAVWQPLAAADPTPVDDHDPFTVGDSEDEDTKKKDIKPDDAKKLEKAMAEAAGDDIGGSEKKAGGEEKSKS